MQQKVVTLSTTETELYAIVQCAHEMIFVLHLLESMNMDVKKPMQLFCDNKGAVLLTNNWSIGGRTRHIEVRQYFLRYLKELKTLICRWKTGKEMVVDIFTKNTEASVFTLHLPLFIG